VDWPKSAGGKGNEGVASFVQQLPNSIGYVEYAYAKQNKMSHVLVKNQAAPLSRPMTSRSRARRPAPNGPNLLPGADRSARKDSWPITGATSS